MDDPEPRTEDEKEQRSKLAACRVANIKVTPREPADVPVENLVELGKFASLIGPGGGGKSTLTENVIAGCAVGELWGETLPRSYTGLIVNSEDDPEDIQRSVLTAAGGHDPDVYYAAPDGRLTAHQVEQLVDDTGAEIVVVNPFIDCLQPMNENDNAEIAALVYPFKRLCLERRICILFVHHSNKGDGEGRQKMRGASSLFDHAALVAEMRVVKEDLEWAVHFAKRRGGPRRKPLALRSNGTHFEPTTYVRPDTPATILERELLGVLRARTGEWLRAAEIVAKIDPKVAGRSSSYQRLTELRKRRDIDFHEETHSYRFQPEDDSDAPGSRSAT